MCCGYTEVSLFFIARNSIWKISKKWCTQEDLNLRLTV